MLPHFMQPCVVMAQPYYSSSPFIKQAAAMHVLTH